MKDNPVIADLRPWCIGRMVFDRPAESSLSYERYKYSAGDISIKENVSEHTFQRLMQERENELRHRKRTYPIPYKEMLEKDLPSMDIETTTPWLEMMGAPSPRSRIFIYKNEEAFPNSAFQREGHILAGTTQLKVTGLLWSADLKKFFQIDNEWYRQTKYLDAWSVPVERGFCINGALIGGVPRSNEWVDQIFLLMPGRPATFIVTMRSALDIDQQNSLLKTVPDLRRRLDGRLLLSKVKILRERKREFAGMPAEEVLLSMKADGVQLFRFYLIAPGTPKDRARPYTAIRLDLGGKPRYGLPPEQATSPVDEAGALQAWDTLLDSFRVRPGAI